MNARWIAALFGCTALILPACGDRESPDAGVEEIAEPVLPTQEEMEQAAEERIDAANADQELEQLIREIEADAEDG